MAADMPYPLALLATLAIEVPLWTLLLPLVAGSSTARSLAVAIGVNVVSHPLLWFVLVPLLTAGTGDNLAGIALSELAVLVAEATMAWGVVRSSTPAPAVARQRPGRVDVIGLAGVALAVNALSWGAGLLVAAPK